MEPKRQSKVLKLVADSLLNEKFASETILMKLKLQFEFENFRENDYRMDEKAVPEIDAIW
jgi:hypothetical protein